MKKTQVLHVIKTLSLGGAETNLLNLANALIPQQVESHVAYSWGGEIEERFKANGVRLFKYADASHKIKSLSTVGIVARLAKYILKNKIEIVHTHVFNAHVWAGMAARLTGRKVVEHVHDFRYIGQADREWGGCYINQFRYAEKVSKLSDAVIVLTEQNKEFIIQNRLHPEDEVWLIRNGISMDYSAKSQVNERVKLGIQPDRKIFLTPARMSSEKNIDLLFRVVPRVTQECPEVVFVVAGDGPLLDNYRKRVLDEGLKDRLMFIGFHPNIRNLLAHCDAMILPSFLELHPISILEALSMKVPVMISKNVGCNSEVFANGVNGVLRDPSHPDKWADTLIEWSRNSDRRRLLGENGFRLCQEQFDIKKTAIQIKELYAQLSHT